MDERLPKLAMAVAQTILLDGNANPRAKISAQKFVLSVAKHNFEVDQAIANQDKPQVVINNNVSSRDTFVEFIEKLPPEKQQAWLEEYGSINLPDLQSGDPSQKPTSQSSD